NSSIGLVELQLLYMYVAQEIARKGAQLLGRLNQPLQDRIGVDLEDSRGGTDTQTLGEARQDAHDALHGRLFAVEEGAMGLQKVALARGTVELTPGTTARMAIGPQVAQRQPATIGTVAMRTKVPGRVDLTGTSVRRGHGGRPGGRRRFGLHSVALAQGAMGLVRQALECFGLLGADALGLDGRGWCGSRGRASPGPGEIQHDAEPYDGQQSELG